MSDNIIQQIKFKFQRGHTIETTALFCPTVTYTCVIITTDLEKTGKNNFFDYVSATPIPGYQVIITDQSDRKYTEPFEHRWISEQSMELLCQNKNRGQTVIDTYNKYHISYPL